jgi:hypothetical protein
MPRTNQHDAPVALDIPEAEIRQVDLDGYSVTFNTFKTDSDPAALFRGLPDDACQCPHWGIVLSGELVFRYADHDETYAAGDAYYGPPGHVPLSAAGTQTIEFSPADALQATMAVVSRNMQRLAAQR